ncbi:hypothetical protein VTP01DRAFT_9235 [Rhizomucor pusillus]|uniref:uncharacterized protein n=1 Tax=Rhizomucor pusillus TaxID=4840 RepID=UPI0037420C9B
MRDKSLLIHVESSGASLPAPLRSSSMNVLVTCLSIINHMPIVNIGPATILDRALINPTRAQIFYRKSELETMKSKVHNISISVSDSVLEVELVLYLKMSPLTQSELTAFDRRVDLILVNRNGMIESRLTLTVAAVRLWLLRKVPPQRHCRYKRRTRLDFVVLDRRMGYMFYVKELQGVYIAKCTSNLALPTSAAEFDSFLTTLESLYVWKNHH